MLHTNRRNRILKYRTVFLRSPILFPSFFRIFLLRQPSSKLSRAYPTQKLNQRPFSTLNTIKDLRDTLAHGKPDEKSIDEEVTIEQNAAWERMTLTAEWQKYCTPEFMRIVHEDLNAI